MPLWSISELKRLYSVIPAGLREFSEQELESRYSLAGGVPRVIFNIWTDYAMDVMDALSSVKMSFLAEGIYTCEERGPHSIVGLKVNTRDYKSYSIRFLSPKLKQMVYKHLMTNTEELIRFVMANVGSAKGKGTSFLSDIFELLAKEQLCRGKKSTLVALNDKARGMIQDQAFLATGYGKIDNNNAIVNIKPALEVIAKVGQVDIFSPHPTMWVPDSSSFPVVDFFYSCPSHSSCDPIFLGLKMTVGKTHPINYRKLKELVDLFGNRFILVWVLPHVHFEGFVTQSQKEGRKNVDPTKILSVPQFKLRLPLPEMK
jgi:hypothetical protein